MSDARTRKSLISGMPEPKSSSAGSTKEAKPGHTRTIIMSVIFVVLLALVAWRYTRSDATPVEPEPVIEEQNLPPQPGQPRNTTPPPGQQPIPHDIISG